MSVWSTTVNWVHCALKRVDDEEKRLTRMTKDQQGCDCEELCTVKAKRATRREKDKAHTGRGCFSHTVAEGVVE